MKRIDRAISPPGLIASAWAHTLFLSEDTLFVIRTGRGWRINYNPRGALNKMAAQKAVAFIQKKVAAKETTLAEGNLETLSQEKGSIALPLSVISDIDVKTNYKGLPSIRFKVSGKKYRYEFEQGRDQEVDEFVAGLSS